MKTCFIKQPAGLGDILFCQKIAAKIKEKGYQIVWPVANIYSYLNEYITGINFDDISNYGWFNECGTNIIKLQNDDIYVPLQDGDKHFLNESLMLSKYKFVNVDYSDWHKYLNISRNFDREQKLKNYLNIKPGSEYDVICNTYGTPPTTVECDYMNNHLQNIKLPRRTIKMFNSVEYNVFDWIGVLESSNTIYTTDTCFVYLIDALNLGQQLYMYSRYTPPNFMHIKECVTRPWKMIDR
jgi:hypothetical protein